MVALFNKKKAKAMAEIKERLKAESQARAKAEERLKAEIEATATVEQKIKDETNKMLLTNYLNYSLKTERAKAQAKKEIAAAKAEAKEAIEKARSLAAALYQAEEELNKVQEMARTETMAGAKAEEDLQVEIQEQQIFEAQATEETKHGLFWGHHYNIRRGRILNSYIHRVRVRKQLYTAFLPAK